MLNSLTISYSNGMKLFVPERRWQRTLLITRNSHVSTSRQLTSSTITELTVM